MKNYFALFLAILVMSSCSRNVTQTSEVFTKKKSEVIVQFEARKIRKSEGEVRKVRPSDFFDLTISYYSTDDQLQNILKKLESKYLDAKYEVAEGETIWIMNIKSVNVKVR